MGRPIVISGPSGCGKSTLINRLFREHPNRFMLSISHTTRSPRPGEADGREYHFVSRKEFEEKLERGDFIEHAQFSDNLYGTSLEAIQKVIDSGRVCLLDLELNGVKSMHEMADRFQPRFIFIQPPAIEELRKRLTLRKTETTESLEGRLASVEEAMRYAAEPSSYDIVIVNDDLDTAYRRFAEFITSDLAN